MIKKIIEEKTILNSKLIEYVIYNYDTHQLQVKYKSGKHKGKTKTYNDFDSSALEYLFQSESPGKTLTSILLQMKNEKAKKSIFHKILSYMPFI